MAVGSLLPSKQCCKGLEAARAFLHVGIDGVEVEKQKTCPNLRTPYLPRSLITFHALVTIVTRKEFPASSEPATGSTVYGGIFLGGKGILQKEEKQLPGKGTKR